MSYRLELAYPASPTPESDRAITRISPELWYQILQPLKSAYSQRDLESCSFVCHQLLSSSQSHLFSSIYLTNHANIDLALRKFSPSASPHLASHVREITIIDYDQCKRSEKHKDDIASLTEICSGLVKISVVSGLPYPAGSGQFLGWSPALAITPATIEPQNPTRPGLMFHSLQLPSIHTLSIISDRGINAVALPRFLNTFPGLRTLAFEHTGSQPILRGCDIAPGFNLETLALRSNSSCGEFLTWLLPALRTLKHLDIELRGFLSEERLNAAFAKLRKTEMPGGNFHASEWLRYVGRNVSSLTLCTSSNQPTAIHGFYPLLHSEYTPHLQNLTFDHLRIPGTLSPQFLNDIFDLSAERNLNSLSLHFHVVRTTGATARTQTDPVYIPFDWDDFLNTLRDRNWDEVDRHPFKLHLHFSFNEQFPSWEDRVQEIYSTLEDDLTGVLRPLAVRGRLYISRSRMKSGMRPLGMMPPFMKPRCMEGGDIQPTGRLEERARKPRRQLGFYTLLDSP